ALCAAIRASGAHVAAFKPVVTGVAEEPGFSAARNATPGDGPAAAVRDTAGAEGSPFARPDHELLAAVTGARPEAVTTRTFGPAVSPHLAAELAGETIALDALVDAAARLAAGTDVLVVEGVGGLLVPLDDEHDIRDLAVALGLPVVIAARPGLGTINHSLLTIEAARAKGLDVRAVVLTPWPVMPTVMERSNRDTIASRAAIEVATLPVARDVDDLARAGATLPWPDWLGGLSFQGTPRSNTHAPPFRGGPAGG
ncbi:MAG: dethiobiotin synthetase, partial [bacterium]